MNDYQVALLRLLLKSGQGMRISTVIEGFPDNSEDYVLAAISELKDLAFVQISSVDAADGIISPSATISLNKEKKREAMLVVFPDLHSHSAIEDQDANPSSSTGKGRGNSVMAIGSGKLPLIMAGIFAASLIFTVVYAAGPGVTFFSDGDQEGSSYDYNHHATENHKNGHADVYFTLPDLKQNHH